MRVAVALVLADRGRKRGLCLGSVLTGSGFCREESRVLRFGREFRGFARWCCSRKRTLVLEVSVRFGVLGGSTLGEARCRLVA